MNVEEILYKLKKAVAEGKYDMVPTKKNRDSRRKYGLTILDIEDIFTNLCGNDLYKGPIEDRDFIGEELFVFKKRINSKVIFYI